VFDAAKIPICLSWVNVDKYAILQEMESAESGNYSVLL
jgi:hypothetical protein